MKEVKTTGDQSPCAAPQSVTPVIESVISENATIPNRLETASVAHEAKIPDNSAEAKEAEKEVKKDTVLPAEASNDKCFFAATNLLQTSLPTFSEAHTTFKQALNTCLERNWYKKGLDLFSDQLYKIALGDMTMEEIQYYEGVKHKFFRAIHTTRSYPRMGIHTISCCNIYADGFFRNCFTPEECLCRLHFFDIYRVFYINPNISFAIGLARDPILAQWASYRISEAIAIGEPVKDIIITTAAIIQSVDSGSKYDTPLATLLRNQVRIDEKKMILDLDRIRSILGYIEEYTSEVNRGKCDGTQRLVTPPSLK